MTWLDKIRGCGHEVFTAVAEAIQAAYIPSDRPSRSNTPDSWVACANSLTPVAARLHELGASPEQREVLHEFVAIAFKGAGRPLDTWLAEHRRSNVAWYDQLTSDA